MAESDNGGAQNLIDSAGDAGAEKEGNNPGEGGSAENDAAWFLAEGQAGTGERPEWHKDKYKTVSDQAKAYVELEKRFGGFVGAPEAYEFKPPEGVSIDMPDNDPLLSGFNEIAKTANMSQDTYNQITNLFFDAMAGDSVDPAAERKALGDNAAQRLNNLNDWAAANLDKDTHEAFKSMATTASSVQVLEAMMQASRQTPQALDDAPTNSGVTPQALKDLQFAKDDNGNRRMATDPDYRKMVEAKFNEFYGGAPASTIIG